MNFPFHPNVLLCKCAKCKHQYRLLGADVASSIRVVMLEYPGASERWALEQETRLERMRVMCDE